MFQMKKKRTGAYRVQLGSAVSWWSKTEPMVDKRRKSSIDKAQKGAQCKHLGEVNTVK